MTNSERQTPREFSDAVIRRFLLARLAADERPAFERSLFTSAELEQRVRLAEIELADDYAFGRLHRSDAKLFEKNFLLSTERLRLLNTSRGLRARNQTAARALQPLFSAGSWLSRKFSQRTLKVAFAAVLLILAIGAAWLVIRKEPQIKQEIAKRFTRKRPTSPPTPTEANHPTNTSAPQHHEPSTPLPEHEPGMPPALTVTLSSNDRDSAPSISIPNTKDAVVRFALKVEHLSSEYNVKLVSGQGQTIYITTVRPISSSGVAFDAPAALLRPNEHEIRLIDSRSQATTKYYFRVK